MFNFDKTKLIIGNPFHIKRQTLAKCNLILKKTKKLFPFKKFFYTRLVLSTRTSVVLEFFENIFFYRFHHDISKTIADRDTNPTALESVWGMLQLWSFAPSSYLSPLQNYRETKIPRTSSHRTHNPATSIYSCVVCVILFFF